MDEDLSDSTIDDMLPPPPPLDELQATLSDVNDFPSPPPPSEEEFSKPPLAKAFSSPFFEEDDMASSDGLNDASGDEEEVDFTDADAAIDKMLDDLSLFQEALGPDKLKDKKENFDMITPTRPMSQPFINNYGDKTLDHLRLSINNIEETPEVDLDALLEDLCSMERDIENSSAATLKRKGYNIDPVPNDDMTLSPTRKLVSPVMVTEDVKERLENLQSEMEAKELSPEEQEAKLKAEKVRIALEKLKAASFQKRFIKVYNNHLKTSKMWTIDQTWAVRDLVKKMIAKDNVEMGANWCIVEKLPHLWMERILEDHEYVLQTVLDWTRESENMLVFLNRRDKYQLFKNPQNFLLTSMYSTEDTKLAEKSKDTLLNEFFKKENTQIPEVEGQLWLRQGTKKWTKHYFVLRASGIYYTPKGKQKSRDLSYLTQFEHNNVYLGVSFKKRFKAPTDHVFCLKHPKVQAIKSKHIYCLCTEDNKQLFRWIAGIRMAKYGYNLYEDYMKTQENVESVLLAGSNPVLANNNTVSMETNSGLMNVQRRKDSKKTLAERKRTTRNAVEGSNEVRVKGKQASLADLFETAWSKGVEEEDSVPATPFSPTSETLLSPTLPPVTFEFANRAMSTVIRPPSTPGKSSLRQPDPPQLLVTNPPPPPTPVAGVAPSDARVLTTSFEATLTAGMTGQPPPPPPPPPPLPPS